MKCEACAKCARIRGTQRAPQCDESSACIPLVIQMYKYSQKGMFQNIYAIHNV